MVIIDGSFLPGVAGIITSVASFVKVVVVLRGPDARCASDHQNAHDAECIAERRIE